MRAAVLLVALVTIGCGSSSPTAPSTPVVTPPVVVVPPPVVQQMISVSPCPTEGPADLNFFREMGCNAFETPIQPVRRWTVAPKLYLKTVDEAGAAIDPVTLDTAQRAFIESAPQWTAGKLSVTVERGTGSKEGATGWITVRWPGSFVVADLRVCGHAQVATDGGWIELNYQSFSCGCNGSRIAPSTVRHELGHALGYWHTDNESDLMFASQNTCDAVPSARELQAINYFYR